MAVPICCCLILSSPVGGAGVGGRVRLWVCAGRGLWAGWGCVGWPFGRAVVGVGRGVAGRAVLVGGCRVAGFLVGFGFCNIFIVFAYELKYLNC